MDFRSAARAAIRPSNLRRIRQVTQGEERTSVENTAAGVTQRTWIKFNVPGPPPSRQIRRPPAGELPEAAWNIASRLGSRRDVGACCHARTVAARRSPAGHNAAAGYP